MILSLAVLLPCAVLAASIIYSNGTGQKTADALIYTGKSAVTAIYWKGGASDGTIVVYDNTAASGTKYEWPTEAGKWDGMTFGAHPLKMENGIYVDITTTAQYYVFYFGRGAP